MRTIAGLLALFWLGWGPGAGAEEMQFRLLGTGGNCAGCEWIQAAGEITEETPGAFAAFAKEQEADGSKLRNRIIYLDSAGGSVSAAVELGEAFRRAGVVTAVGASRLDTSDPNPAIPSYELTAGRCASACFFAFAGGIRRTIRPNTVDGRQQPNLLGIHRFTSEQTGQSIVSAQQLSGMLSSYLSRMGLDPAILALAASVPDQPPGNMHYLTQEEAIRYRVINLGLPPPAWALQRSRDGLGLVAALKGTTERDVSSYATWDYEIALACRRAGAERFVLDVRFVADQPFWPENSFVREVSEGFSFGLRWQGGGGTYEGRAATKNDPASAVYRQQTDGWSFRKVDSFDLVLARSSTKDRTMTLSFALGPRSLAVLDRAEKLWFVSEGKSHADEGWIPDQLPLPWEQRANIGALLRTNCVAAGSG